MRQRAVQSASWLALTALLSCAARVAPVDPDAGPDVPVRDVAVYDASPPIPSCLHLATAWCNKLDACTQGLGIAAYFPDASTCIARYADLCMRKLAAPETTVTPALQDACADAYTAQDCEEFRGDMEPSGCVPPPGPRADGMACVADGQCQSTVCRVPTSGTSQCGVCAPQPADGDSCAMLSCGRNLRCVENDRVTTLRCRRPRFTGELCASELPCADYTACILLGADTTGRCRAPKFTIGAGCDFYQVDCQSEVGLTCPFGHQVCTLGTPATTGMPCSLDGTFTEFTYCAAGSNCSNPTLQSGTCIGPAPDWGGCKQGAQLPCLRPFRCQLYEDHVTPGLAGRCVTLDPYACD